MLISQYLTRLAHIYHIEMQHSLFHLFSLYGDILEITVKRHLKMKGQAFVVFSNVEAATRAMQECQEYLFFSKKMVNSQQCIHLFTFL